ncbi:MAG: hypothetical protein JXA78_06685 [Anaerolineales bacterium]|nr:hypothetical protein [Anaerolineales bacterium]
MAKPNPTPNVRTIAGVSEKAINAKRETRTHVSRCTLHAPGEIIAWRGARGKGYSGENLKTNPKARGGCGCIFSLPVVNFNQLFLPEIARFGKLPGWMVFCFTFVAASLRYLFAEKFQNGR